MKAANADMKRHDGKCDHELPPKMEGRCISEQRYEKPPKMEAGVSQNRDTKYLRRWKRVYLRLEIRNTFRVEE